MTREEAIRELREDKALYETDNCRAGDGSPDGDLLEALDMAIEALQAEYEDYEHATLVDIKEPLKVAVVRCKDCIHQGYGKCPMFDDYLENETHDDDYCSYGEIAEGGDAEVTGTPSYMQQSRHDDGRPQEELLTHEQAWEEIGRPHGEQTNIIKDTAESIERLKAMGILEDRKFPFHDEIMEKLDKLTLRGKDDSKL